MQQGWGRFGIASVIALVCVAILWGTGLPLGVPGEWTWPRLSGDPLTLGNLFLGSLGAGLYVTAVGVGGQWLSRATSRVQRGCWLLVLGIAAGGWLWTVQETAPPAGQLGKVPFVLFYPSSSGYFTKARFEAPAASVMLRDYEDLMAEGDVLHVGTHPPGLFLVFHGLIAVQKNCPSLSAWCYQWAPLSFREALQIVRENSAATPTVASAADGEILWLAYVLVLCCSAATVWPIYGLLRWQQSAEAAWWGAAWWPTIPALAIFQPKSDAVYPFFAACFVYACVGSWRARSFPGAMLAGLCLWLGLMASLAFLPVLLFAGLYVASDWWTRRRVTTASSPSDPAPTLATVVRWGASVATGWALPIVLLKFGTGVNLLSVWRHNYINHAGFYAQYSRTWWKWFLVNPVELLFAVGAPLLVLAAVSAWHIVRCWRITPTAKPTGRLLALVTGVSVWGLLWISGKNSGEAARLWLLLMPGVVWLAAMGTGLTNASASPPPGELPPLRTRIAWLLLQLGIGLLTVHRVGGFHFTQSDYQG